jgi:hypothetical protein
MQLEPRIVDHPADDQAAFGDEQTVLAQQLAVRNAAIERRARIHAATDR